MAEKVEAPPAYTPTDVQQHQMTSPVAGGGQANYGFSQPQFPGYNPQPGYFVGQQASNNVVVTQVGGGNFYNQPLPYDYTTQAWFACFCCFWPTGLVAIMRANESRDALARGDLATAHTTADSSRRMVQMSWAVGCVSFIVFGIFLFVYLLTLFS